MNAKFSKRLAAYIFDMIFIYMVLVVVSAIMPVNENVKVLNLELDTINEKLMKNDISASNYLYQYSDIVYQLDKNNIVFTIINVVLVLIYFVLIPYYKNGQTLGKRWMKIRIVKNDDENVTPNELIIRNMITNGLLYTLVGLACIYLMPSFPYFIVVAILGIAQFVVVIYCMFMILYREDKRGLHDIITKTKVVNCN